MNPGECPRARDRTDDIEITPKVYTYADVFHAAKTEEHFDYVFWIDVLIILVWESIVKLFGKVLVVIAITLIAFFGFSGFFVILPQVTDPYTIWFYFNVLLGLLMFSNIVFHYYMVCTTDPGSPNPHDDDDLQVIERGQNTAHQAEKHSPSSPQQMSHNHAQCLNHEHCTRHCNVCHCIKPERSHHCSVCKRCILKMDHHCPWVNNCVGLNNYRYFFLFLFWITIATGYITAVGGTPFVVQEYRAYVQAGHDLNWRMFKTSQPRLRGNKSHLKDHIKVAGGFTSISVDTNASSITKLGGSTRGKLRRHYEARPNYSGPDHNHIGNGRKLLASGGQDQANENLNGKIGIFLLLKNLDLVQSDISTTILAIKEAEKSSAERTPESSSGDRSPNISVNEIHESAASMAVSPLFMLTNFNSLSAAVDAIGATEVTTVFTLILSLAVFVAAGGLFGFHVYLVLSAQTTLELYRSGYERERFRKLGLGTYRSPYYRTPWVNLLQALGGGPWYRSFFPTYSIPLPAVPAPFPTDCNISISNSSQPAWGVLTSPLTSMTQPINRRIGTSQSIEREGQ